MPPAPRAAGGAGQPGSVPQPGAAPRGPAGAPTAGAPIPQQSAGAAPWSASRAVPAGPGAEAAGGHGAPGPAFPALTPTVRPIAGGAEPAPGQAVAPTSAAPGYGSWATVDAEVAPPDPRESATLDPLAGIDEPTLVISAGAGPADDHGPRPDREPAGQPPAPEATPAGPEQPAHPAPPAGGAAPAGATSAGAGGAPGVGAPRPAPRRCGECRAGAIDDDGYCENCGHAQPRERDHMEEELAFVAAASDRGLRHHRNEDAFALSEAELPDGSPAVVAVVCDGVSSATRPDDASAAAARVAGERLQTALPRGTHPQQAMHEAIIAAAEAVNALAQEARPAHRDPHRHENAPACTIVSAVVASGILTVGWIGDSRAYWVPDDRATPAARLTEDDSWAAQMVAAGLLSEQEAYADERAHAITGWLGADAYEIEPHTAAFKPDRPGVVVVCTDGLWNYAESAPEMAAAVPPDARARPMDSARKLVGYALEGGGHDNVTVAVVPFPLPPEGAGSA
ncbi:protein phosphatase 2C domain-containing protein [Streptomyces sp. 71268]|uniref:protein phosphatase 2C domain-containing protein n=1 Tax=Streptomyces sp. 71268 TaxID=3002640 RepID=UPI0023F7CA22|nr:protein phosphatase 2C domain-containing protein [Streptomyces sp. 71268]WEV29933.1 protein phosphatase 2C domain-containing protein [Streptomyces sp. 71268]